MSPNMQAVSPPPDGGYPGGNTAEGQNALLSLTSGTYNTAVGLFSLRTLTDGRFNTAVGAGALLYGLTFLREHWFNAGTFQRLSSMGNSPRDETGIP